MLLNNAEIEKQTSGLKTIIISARSGDIADCRSIGNSLDGGCNLEAGEFCND